MKIMTFFLGGQSYAVDLSAVSAVAARDDAPAGVPLDLAAILGIGAVESVARDALLVLRGEGEDVAVRVDRMGEVLEVDEGAVREVPRYFDSPFLLGVITTGDRLVVLLDPQRLVGPEGRAAAVAASEEEGA